MLMYAVRGAHQPLDSTRLCSYRRAYLSTILLVLALPFGAMAQTSYTWTGAASTAWNDPGNWSPNTGFPGPSDHATIPATANSPVLDADRSITNLTVTTGTLDLGGRVLTFTGTGGFTGGAVNNGILAPNNTASTITFAGTTFGASISGTTADLLFNGGTFNGAIVLTKTSTNLNYGAGGNTFNAKLDLTVAAGRLYLDYTGIDAFNGDLVFSSTGTSGGIWLGQNTGSATLAAGRTIAIGGSGFTVGSLLFRNFTQSGTTPQGFVLTGTSTLYFQNGCTFNADLTCSAPGLYVYGSTFQGAVKLTKTGATNEYSSGGCVFNGTAEFVVTGSGQLSLDNTGTDQFNGNVLLGSTNVGGVRFGAGGGSAVLAAGRTLGIGSAGYTMGTLLLQNFTHAGTSTTVLNLGANANITIQGSTVFTGNLVASAGAILLHGGTFQGNVRFTKTGASTDWGLGGCVFNGSCELTNTSSGLFGLDHTNTDQFAGNIVVNNTSIGSIRFGNSTTSAAVLAAGRTLSVGGGGFASGLLLLRNFTQLGTTAQVITVGPAATVMFSNGNTFGGTVNITAGALNVTGSTFNSGLKLTKTGTSLISWYRSPRPPPYALAFREVCPPWPVAVPSLPVRAASPAAA